MEETTNAIKQSCEDQKKGITTFIEIILNQELGEPFRRDAMKKPVCRQYHLTKLYCWN